MGMLEISGTDIRARVREGRPFRYLVTGEVHAYIVDNDLYANEPEDDMVGQRMDMETTS
jgi:nicotinic acid mononucleotide adenylyltransferase